MKKFFLIIFVSLLAISAKAQEAYLGEIRMVGFNYAPPGWAQCNGQTLPVMQYQALYALIGTTYGGDGRNNFALPDLRGRTALHPSQGAQGVVDVNWGSKGGTPSVSIVPNNLPFGVGGPIGVVKNDTARAKVWAGAPGGYVPLSTQPPYVGVYYIICVSSGYFPPHQ